MIRKNSKKEVFRDVFRLMLLLSALLLVQCTGQTVNSVYSDSNDMSHTDTSRDTVTNPTTIDITTYNDNSILGQAIKDDILANDDVIIRIKNLPNITLRWTFGSASGTEDVSQNEIKLTKSMLPNLNNLTDGTVLPLNVYEGETLQKSDRLTYKPFEIWGWEDLQAMRKNIAAHYTLETSISFPDSQKFEPIPQPFTGSLNGKGNAINQLLIEGEYSLSGLFEHLQEAEVSNIVFIHPIMDVTQTTQIGSLSLGSGIVAATASNSTIDKISIRGNGKMIIRDSIMRGPIGMLVGVLSGSTVKNSYVLSSHVYRDVDSNALQLLRTVAGIVGTNRQSSMLNIYWAGKMFSNINAAEKINPTTYMDYQSQAQYYSQLDPIVGFVVKPSTFSHIFWDNDITQTDLTLSIDSNQYATPKNTTEMKQQSTYDNWDFVNIWDIDPTVNDGYPFLRGQVK